MNSVLTVLLMGIALPAGAGILQGGSFQGLQEDAEMEALVKEILGAIDLHNEIPVVIHPNAQGCAYARTISTGQQFVGYDPACLGPLHSGRTYNWRALGIVCHEVGHILGGHTLNATNSYREELEADEWAGWAMRNRGATLDEAQTVFRTFSEKASSTHPARADRLGAVERGWMRANGQSGSAKLPPPSRPSLPPPDPPPPRPISQQGTRWGDLMESKLPWVR